MLVSKQNVGARGGYLSQSEEYRVQRKVTSPWAENAWDRLEWPMSQQGAISLCQIGVPTSRSWVTLLLSLMLITFFIPVFLLFPISFHHFL